MTINNIFILQNIIKRCTLLPQEKKHCDVPFYSAHCIASNSKKKCARSCKCHGPKMAPPVDRRLAQDNTP
jgi:hypothetical protein